MGNNLQPGKGGFFHLNGDTLGFLKAALDDLYEVLTEGGSRDLNEALDNDEATELFKQAKAELTEGDDATWSYEKDKFGQKVFKAMDWETGAYRVTLVLSRGELKIDVRNWYDPKAER